MPIATVVVKSTKIGELSMTRKEKMLEKTIYVIPEATVNGRKLRTDIGETKK